MIQIWLPIAMIHKQGNLSIWPSRGTLKAVGLLQPFPKPLEFPLSGLIDGPIDGLGRHTIFA